MCNKVIAFPQMGDYHVPAKYFFKHTIKVKIIDIPKITNKTIELGVKYSPEFVCTPFKYTIGTLIESLDMGANILVQLGGGCKYGYYSELQEKILKDLNYKFTFISLVTAGKTDIKKIYKEIKKIDSNFSIIKSLYYLFITVKMIKYMDKIDHYIRKNIGFEVNKNDFIKLKNEMLNKFSNVKTYTHLLFNYFKYKIKFKRIKTNKPKKPLKVAIIGELYTIMEPFANYNIENILASYNIEVTRFTNAHYLLLEKKYKIKYYLRKAKKYIKYKMGADASDNIARTLLLCNKKYDGIIHIKSTFCTPEIGAIPIIDKICKEHKVPIIYFSFDSNTSEIGIITRLEALIDMIERKNL